MEDRPVKSYWLQVKTGKLHTRRNCMVTRRTRYSHAQVDLTPNEVSKYPKCEKCWSA